MDARTKTRIALGAAFLSAVLAVAWRATRSEPRRETPMAATVRAAARGANATPPSNGDVPNATASAANGPPLPPLDRKKADEMRDAIHKLLAEAGPAWAAIDDAPDAGARALPTALYPEMPASDLKDEAGVSENAKYIQRRVREDLFPLARQCYDEQLAKNPKLAGRFVMHFRIVGDRRVGGVVDTATMADSSTLTNPDFARCMTESMMSVTFDAPPGHSGQVTVTYPIVFSPVDDDAGGAD